MQCRVCDKQVDLPFALSKLCDKSVRYFDCKFCGYVQTEAPTWLREAYAAPINASDTGIMVRNQENARVVLATLKALGLLQGRVVDYAGGYGILTRMLRDIGVDAWWADQYCENLLAKGFEYDGTGADLVTGFEVFEHFVHPAEELSTLFTQAPNVLISTQLISRPAPAPDSWWYYGLEHGQHIGFARTATLEYLAKKFCKQLVSDGHTYHLFCDRDVSLPVWRLYRLIGRCFPKLLAFGLESKTLSDYEILAARRDENRV